MTKLKQDFYLRDDVIQISKDLLGKFLVTNINGKVTSGIIIETESYKGPEDKASHAYNNKRTTRTETMFRQGGIAYVYLCYGMHNLFNIVTNKENIPHAILIRAIKPVDGIEVIQKRRNLQNTAKSLTNGHAKSLTNGHAKNLTNGPGTLTKALGITKSHDQESLLGNKIWLEDRKVVIKDKEIIAGPRVGIAYAEEYVHMPWRFRINI